MEELRERLIGTGVSVRDVGLILRAIEAAGYVVLDRAVWAEYEAGRQRCYEKYGPSECMNQCMTSEGNAYLAYLAGIFNRTPDGDE